MLKLARLRGTAPNIFVEVNLPARERQCVACARFVQRSSDCHFFLAAREWRTTPSGGSMGGKKEPDGVRSVIGDLAVVIGDGMKARRILPLVIDRPIRCRAKPPKCR